MSVSLIYADTKSVSESSSTTLDVSIDSSVAAGDMIVIGYMCRSSISAPSGFTKYEERTDGMVGSQRHGYFIKASASGSEDGAPITLTQSSSQRIEANHAIFRASGTLGVSQTGGADAGSNFTYSPPGLTEAGAFLAISQGSNYYATSTRRSIDMSGSSDAEWAQMNTDYWADTNHGRLSWAYALYAGADTTSIEWDFSPVTSRDSSASIITILEAAPSGGGIRNPLGGPMAPRNPMGRM